MYYPWVKHSPSYIYSNFYSIIGPFFVPLNEFLLYPLLRRCVPNFKVTAKFFIGLVLRFGWCVIVLILLTYARYAYINNTISEDTGRLSNATLSCVFHATPSFLSDVLDYRWTILLEIIVVLSDQLMIVATLEFYCSQVPYSVKGFVAGALYGIVTFFMMISQVMLLPFKSKSIDWGTGALSCGFWHLLTTLIYMLITFTVFGIVAKWYKRRKREDVLPNEHIFAENYYSQ